MISPKWPHLPYQIGNAMNLNDILTAAYQNRASDIHFKSGLPPMLRIDGRLVPFGGLGPCVAADLRNMALAIMSPQQREKFQARLELDMAYVVPDVARFRVNIFQQRGVVGAVFRVIPFQTANIEQLGLPEVVCQIAAEERGLILVTGTTGCGKSTTMAAIIDQINATRTAHILTIEEPIEFLMQDKCSLINQREIGIDTQNYATALKSALRQDPDVIFIGEMRDMETIEVALTAAETGHLVLSTLHTLDVTETISRIVSVFPPHQQRQVRTQLGTVLKAVICQRLVPRADGRGRVPAVEVMRVTGRIRDLIDDPERTREIPQAVSEGVEPYGMQTFDQALMKLVTGGLITYTEAMRQATHPEDFALRYSGIHGTSDAQWNNFENPGAFSADSGIDGEDSGMEITLGSKYE